MHPIFHPSPFLERVETVYDYGWVSFFPFPCRSSFLPSILSSPWSAERRLLAASRICRGPASVALTTGRRGILRLAPVEGQIDRSSSGLREGEIERSLRLKLSSIHNWNSESRV